VVLFGDPNLNPSLFFPPSAPYFLHYPLLPVLVLGLTMILMAPIVTPAVKPRLAPMLVPRLRLNAPAPGDELPKAAHRVEPHQHLLVQQVAGVHENQILASKEFNSKSLVKRPFLNIRNYISNKVNV